VTDARQPENSMKDTIASLPLDAYPARTVQTLR
jgi:hypothetical protein